MKLDTEKCTLEIEYGTMNTGPNFLDWLHTKPYYRIGLLVSQSPTYKSEIGLGIPSFKEARYILIYWRSILENYNILDYIVKYWFSIQVANEWLKYWNEKRSIKWLPVNRFWISMCLHKHRNVYFIIVVDIIEMQLFYLLEVQKYNS